jgi:hypothetical protein
LAVDTRNLTQLDVEPGTLPETMAAWVIRKEREGDPKDAFRLEQIEVPEPGIGCRNRRHPDPRPKPPGNAGGPAGDVPTRRP